MNEAPESALSTHDPFAELMRLHQEAIAADDPSAWFAVVATVGSDGYPCCRTLTLRTIGKNRLTFHVNARSPKIRHLEENGKIEILFLWPKMLRQVRVRGQANWEQDEDLAQAWRSKPQGCRVADLMHAHCLEQSSVISGRNTLLMEQARAFGLLGPDGDVPTTVVTLSLVPDYLEIWIASPEDRLHDRRRYLRRDSSWLLQHLVP